MAHNKSECAEMITIVKNRSVAYKDLAKRRKFQRQMEDLNRLLVAEELLEYDNSDLIEQCRFKMQYFWHLNKTLGLQAFTSCRDYILMIHPNATHPGALR